MLRYGSIILFLAFINSAWAGPYDPIVSKAWVEETVPGQDTTTLQLSLTTVKAATLLSVESPLVKSIEIHSLKMHKGKMRQQVVDKLSLPSHQTITFGSKNLFLMMSGIKQTLNAGDKLTINLLVKVSGKPPQTITAEAEIKKVGLSYKHYKPNNIYDHR